jgi:hypothetical protein
MDLARIRAVNITEEGVILKIPYSICFGRQLQAQATSSSTGVVREVKVKTNRLC